MKVASFESMQKKNLFSFAKRGSRRVSLLTYSSYGVKFIKILSPLNSSVETIQYRLMILKRIKLHFQIEWAYWNFQFILFSGLISATNALKLLDIFSTSLKTNLKFGTIQGHPANDCLV